jgi:hypothetical protein
MRESRARRRIATAAALVAVVGLAAFLRFWRLDEMEYKGDEQWTYVHAMRIPAQDPWPLVGMKSSTGLPNPGLSVIVFVGLAKAVGARSPTDLAAGVVTLNVAALALAFLFASRLATKDEREAWRWGGVLAAVSPFAVLMQRKIWAQSLLPIFSMLFLVGWWRRDSRWGALLWGVLSACLGQIHMSGFFFAAGFVLWEWLAGRQRADRPATRWQWFAAGALVGGIGIGFWIVGLVPATEVWLAGPAAGSAAADHVPAANILGLWPSFWLDWFEDAAGVGLEYSLGPHYREFLQGPLIMGRSSWLPLIATVTSAVVAARIAVPCALGAVRDLRAGEFFTRLRTCSETAFTEAAAIGPFGLLLSIVCIGGLGRFYLIVAFPLQWVWLSRLALRQRRGRTLLAALAIVQLVISLAFLGFIHEHQGAEGADYGRGYRWQTSQSRSAQTHP